MEDYDKIKKVLALGFMNFLDENKSKDKMCLSNGECEDIEKAFNEQDWPKLARYLDKYRESEDERMMREFNDWLCEEIECRTSSLCDEKDRKILNMLCYVLTKVKDWLKEQKEHHYTKRNALFDECVAKCDHAIRKKVSDKVDKMLGKEQKPAEKQDYSGLNDSERAILRGFLAAGIRNVPVGIIKETAKDCIAHFPWPTKWSKEDENTINELCNIIASNSKNGYLGRHYAGDLVQKLKALRPCPSWKPSEEQMMKDAVEIGTAQINWEQDGDRAFPTFDPPAEDLLIPGVISQKFNDGDKVKIIIVKED